MTPDQYLQQIFSKYAVSTGVNSPPSNAGNKIYPTIKTWGGNALKEVLFSGSYAKGTAVKGGTDVDLFISLSSTTTSTLQEIYDSLFSHLLSNGFEPRKQNVSIGIVLDGVRIDLIPAKRQDSNSNDHSLWKNKAQTWTKTNIVKHINMVSNSGRLDEIKLTKIWRNQNNLDFPSIYLELFVMDALYNKNTNQLSTNFLTVLESLTNNLRNKRIIDPSNTQNIISDDIEDATKKIISSKAFFSKTRSSWEDVIS